MLYKTLVLLYEKLDSTSKRLEKTYHISQLIRETGKDDLPLIILMVQGKMYPEWEETKIGVSSKLVVKAINKATGISEKDIEAEWKKQGDLGLVAEHLIKKKKQSSLFPKSLSVKNVFENIRGLSSLGGKGSVDRKLAAMSELFINATPKEAKYIARTLVDNLRIGIGKGTLRDAIIWAYFTEKLGIKYDPEKISIEVDDREKYNEVVELIRRGYDLTNDFGKVAVLLKERGLRGLDEIELKVGTPINPMLYQKAEDIDDAFKTVGKPAAFEYKLDGFRMQIHKKGRQVNIYTRRLENVTSQFPEVADFVMGFAKAESLILDAEAVGYDPETKKYLPFQAISQRIKRKYDIDEMAEKFPVEVNVFDIMHYDGKSLLDEPFRKRRAILEKAVLQKQQKIVLAKQIITEDAEKAQKFYEESLKMGEEGVMAKNLEGIYKPGSRAGYGVKIKSILEPLDLVIVAAEYGEGKRSGWLSSFILACSDNGELKEIGKVSTGLKELDNEEGTTFREMTGLLKPLITEPRGKYVKVRPEIVIEVGYEEIQKSVNYSSGYALRFPRFLRLRTDEKTVDDINTLEDVERLYQKQRGRDK
ncbi:ATP-dependent DNA ligase [Candidatus Woesearchaeota archaeon]|nr:ATP-dependent DNA ligase [Candidatus Woesearchaeota archaeon]